ncbi:MAG TPA: protein kinase [Kineosporiaceae bacterium]
MTAAPERIADYEVVETLVRPGAETYLLARPPQRLGLRSDLVTIKIVDGRHDQEAFRRVSEELRLFAAVTSPYLVKLYDAGSDDGRVWFSMDHYPIGSLAEPARFLTLQQRTSAVANAARGAHALHEAGIAHRDIRPANILLAEDHAVLADLELARFLLPGRTVTGSAPVADLEYTDPALIRGEPASRASDIWSLGLTLHRVLAQAPGYPGLAHQAGPLPMIRRMLAAGPEISSRIDPEVAAVIRACVAPDPSDRPATALALAELIEAL